VLNSRLLRRNRGLIVRSLLPIHRKRVVGQALSPANRALDQGHARRFVASPAQTGPSAYKTARFLSRRIREAMGLIEAEDDTQLKDTIEVDETYVGGKYDNRRARAKYDKAPAFGLVEHDSRARTYHVKNVNRHNVIDKIKDNIAISADAVYTDDSRLYDRMLENVQKHEIVNHSAKE